MRSRSVIRKAGMRGFIKPRIKLSEKIIKNSGQKQRNNIRDIFDSDQEEEK